MATFEGAFTLAIYSGANKKAALHKKAYSNSPAFCVVPAPPLNVAETHASKSQSRFHKYEGFRRLSGSGRHFDLFQNACKQAFSVPHRFVYSESSSPSWWQEILKLPHVQDSPGTTAPSSSTNPAVVEAVTSPKVGLEQTNGKRAGSSSSTEAYVETVDVPAGIAPLSVCVLGASGDLAVKKIFPALFALYYQDLLPKDVSIFGFARTAMDEVAFRNKLTANLTCRIDFKEDCAQKMSDFLSRCRYVYGPYDDVEAFGKLNTEMSRWEKHDANRIFYFSLPPSAFVSAASSIKAASMAKSGWTRAIIEKPFGRDTESSRLLSESLGRYLTEDQIYRIDHYLAKELVQNLIVLRFANLVFEPLWSRKYVESVQIIFKEDFGTDGRGGYFDQYGIIRDIIQNHLLQILALVAMEEPVTLSAEDIRDEKVKVLRAMQPLDIKDVVVGQYTERSIGGQHFKGYLEDPTVDPKSRTPTFAACVLFVRNRRWDGVPFLVKAGKALDERKAEVRIRFRSVPGALFVNNTPGRELPANELVIRVQPDASIYMKITNKVPGIAMQLEETKLDLNFLSTFKGELPDAYERLILDVCNGEKSLFIRRDELDAAWALFTPALQQLEKDKVKPFAYPYGSPGPAEASYLAAKYDSKFTDHS